MTMSMHERIRSDFEGRILGGILPPGARLPIEQELMQQYGCSRMTVSKALSALAAAGLIDRRRRAGTFVARPQMHSMVLAVPDISVEVVERGQAYSWVPLQRVARMPVADRPAKVALAGSGALMQIDGLHLADGTPLAVEYRLISMAAVPEIATADLETQPPGSWILRHVPWTEAETRISARPALGDVARLLELPVGTPCLCVDRHTWRATERITDTRQFFVGDSYDMVARFGPAAASRESDAAGAAAGATSSLG